MGHRSASARRVVHGATPGQSAHDAWPLFQDPENISLFVFFGNPGLFLAFPVTIAIQAFRARMEARVLDAAFGDAYRAYRAQTWF